MIIHRTCLAILAVAACAAGEAGGPPQPGQGGHPGQRPPPEEIFKAADTNGDSKVTLAELTAYVDQRRADEMGKRFDAMDTNQDGSISKTEFIAFEPPGKEGGKDGKRRMGPDPEEMFKRFDRNGDGVITADELPRREGGKGERGKGEHGEGERGEGERGEGMRPKPPVQAP